MFKFKSNINKNNLTIKTHSGDPEKHVPVHTMTQKLLFKLFRIVFYFHTTDLSAGMGGSINKIRSAVM
jgi:hypothetical protein